MSIHTWVGKMPLPTDVTTLRLYLLRLGSSRRDGSSSSSSAAAAAAASLRDPNVFFLPWHTSTFGKGDQQPFFPLLAFCTLCFFPFPFVLKHSPTCTLPRYLTSNCLAAPSWLRCKESSTGEREREEIPSQFQNTFSQQQYTRWDTGLGLLLDEFLPKPRNGQESCMTKPPRKVSVCD